MAKQPQPRPEEPPTPEEIERRRAWVAKKQADPEFMARFRESLEASKRGEGVPWEVVKREYRERELARKRKRA